MGTLDFGAVDPTKFTGDVSYVPVTQASPSKQFWGIDQSITWVYGSFRFRSLRSALHRTHSYGDTKTPILASGSGIVDTGTMLLYLASDAFQAYTQATGATMDPTTQLLKIDNPNNLQSLFFQMGDVCPSFCASRPTC